MPRAVHAEVAADPELRPEVDEQVLAPGLDVFDVTAPEEKPGTPADASADQRAPGEAPRELGRQRVDGVALGHGAAGLRGGAYWNVIESAELLLLIGVGSTSRNQCWNVQVSPTATVAAPGHVASAA